MVILLLVRYEEKLEKYLIETNKIDTSVKLYRYYLLLKKFGLTNKIWRYYSNNKKEILKKLQKNEPNLRWFDLYKLGYLIFTKFFF